MVQSTATTAEQYLAELPEERRSEIAAVRDVVRRNLPEGYRETMDWGMLSWGVPLERYPDTYNKQPLCYISLAAQKNYNALYLMGVYGDAEREQKLQRGFADAGKKLDMGKSCVRFKLAADLPLEVIGELVASMPPDDLIARYEASRRR